MKTINNVKGFTLLELGIVMIIIAALSVVALPKISGMSDGAAGRTILDLGMNLEKANDNFYLQAKEESKHNNPTDTMDVGGAEVATLEFGYLSATAINMTYALVLGDMIEESTDMELIPGGSQFHSVVNNGSVFINYAGDSQRYAASITNASGVKSNTGSNTDASGVTTGGSTCYLQYTPSAGVGSKPEYYVEVGGC
jgi:prepilin-type N-terminal cleavage/methylation domain-containing protein